MEKVTITKEIAEVIGEKMKDSPMIYENDKTLLIYEVLGELNQRKISKLEEGIVTLTKAIQYGYEVEKEFFNWTQACQLMLEGKKMNRLHSGHKVFIHPIYSNGRLVWNSTKGKGTNNFIVREEDILSTKWFVSEEE